MRKSQCQKEDVTGAAFSNTWPPTALQEWYLEAGWWRTPLIPELQRQRQADLQAQGQPGLYSEF